MDNFCGSDFWDVDITWNTENPDLTPCFQQTVLAWVPCAFLWIFSFYDVYISYSNKAKEVPKSPLNLAKTIFTLVLIAIELIYLKEAIFPNNEATTVYVVDHVSPVIKIATYVLYLGLFIYSLQKGVQSSAVHFIFWLLMTICKAIVFRSVIIHRLENPNLLWYILEIIYFPVAAALFFANCWADAIPKFPIEGINSKACPEAASSYLSRLWFSWNSSLIWLGYKKPLEQSDLWNLNSYDTSKHVVSTFNKHWTNELHKNNCKRLRHAEGRAAYGKITNDEGTITNSIHFPTEKQDKNVSGSQNRPEFTASVVPPLFNSFGGSFIFGCLLEVVPSLLAFVSPQILNLLIAYTSNDEELWKGLLYAGTLFLSACISTVFTTQFSYRMHTVCMNIKTALTSAIYKKALLLSNASKMESSVGQLVNFMSVDVEKITDLIPNIVDIVVYPLQIGLALYFLWGILGPSSLAGLGVMILIIPANAWITSKTRQYQGDLMIKKDKRLKLMNEVLSGIKVLKLYAWEPSYEKQIMKIRTEEIAILKKMTYISALLTFMWNCAPFMVALASFVSFVLIDSNNVLDAKVAFVSLSLFNLMSLPLSLLPRTVILMVQANISIKRLNKFMNAEEYDPDAVGHDDTEGDAVVIENGTFSWEPDTTVLRDISLRIKEGSLVAIVGTVGAGKSSLLNVMLGELEKINGSVNTKGTIMSYVAQQAWIQNASLRDNILFGKAYDPSKYDRVIEACALNPDIEILPAGDKTEIGEKGINLSGGQKQRVSLARAAYNNPDVFLLDDVMSAVDSNVGKHIFDTLIGPKGLLKNKTRILVTHGIQYLPQMDNIVVLKDGTINEEGTFKDLLQKNGTFAEFIRTYFENSEKEDISDLELEDISILDDLKEVVDIKKKKVKRSNSESFETGWSDKNADTALPNQTEDSKLIEKETSLTSNVKLTVFLDYIRYGGSWLFIIGILMHLIAQGFLVGSDLFLSSWTSQTTSTNYTKNSTLQSNEGQFSRETFLAVYGSLGIGQATAILVGAFILALGVLQSASNLHYKMLIRIFRGPLTFFDVTPLGRIVNRFSKDVDTCDSTLLFLIRFWLNCLCDIVGIIFAISYSTPIFIAVLAPVSVIYVVIQRVYVPTSRQLRRLESTTRSPIYSHFQESITGCSTIRAFGQQERFVLNSEEKVDLHQRCNFLSITSNRWLQIRLETIGNVIIFFAALFSVLGRGSLEPGLVGLSVSYALRITFSLKMLIWFTADLETNIVAVERIKEYSEIKQEADWETLSRKPPKSWPEKGEVRFDNYQTRYRPGLELILKNVTCVIQPGEKVGIVGRTGAGKSSLTLALFRIIEAAGGSIIIDGQDISKLGLHDIRGRLTIIPQDPILFSGTLRMNLDPLEQHSDETLWHSLELSHLKPFVTGLSAGLEHEISEGGENLSVGQRQLICLARALLRLRLGTKILVLDEATAAVDMETDDLIQRTIRNEFSDSTVITIAHRLNTIMDSDKVMVLDKGEIREYDTPANLLKIKDSVFSGMAKDAGIQ